jgi:hypothetical protein
MSCRVVVGKYGSQSVVVVHRIPIPIVVTVMLMALEKFRLLFSLPFSSLPFSSLLCFALLVKTA